VADTRSEYDGLASLYLPVAIAVAAIVFGAVLFALLRYRSGRAGRPSGRSDAPLLEAGYVLLLVAVAGVLIGFSFDATADIDRGAKHPALELDVTAAKWNWRFDYRGSGVSQVGTDTRPPILVVPTGEPVRFYLRSIDVQHAFWVPDRRFKRDAFPGRTTHFDLDFDKPGTSTSGACAEYCGLRHADMRFTVHALRPGDFAAWLQRRERGG
jgi:cytochrome c oxidase subunit II